MVGETGVSNYELLVPRIVYTMYKLLCRLRGPGFRACAGLQSQHRELECLASGGLMLLRRHPKP